MRSPPPRKMDPEHAGGRPGQRGQDQRPAAVHHAAQQRVERRRRRSQQRQAGVAAQAWQQQADEHGVQRHAKAGREHRRQQAGRRRADGRTAHPGRVGDGDHTEEKRQRAVFGRCGREDGEGFVGNAEGRQQPRRQAAARQAVVDAGAHDDMPQIEQEGGQDDGRQPRALRDHADGHHLAGPGKDGQRHEHGFGRREARLPRHDRVSDADRHKAEHDRQPGAHAAQVLRAAACGLGHRSFPLWPRGGAALPIIPPRRPRFKPQARKSAPAGKGGGAKMRVV